MDRFNNAVNKLVKAFFDGTLKKGNCTACAVGNLCNGAFEWKSVFVTDVEIKTQLIRPLNYKGKAKEVIDKTGYSWQELARVEAAFENNTKIFNSEKELIAGEMEDQYNGLMAVIEVLCEIEGFDQEKEKETKMLFSLKEKENVQEL